MRTDRVDVAAGCCSRARRALKFLHMPAASISCAISLVMKHGSGRHSSSTDVTEKQLADARAEAAAAKRRESQVTAEKELDAPYTVGDAVEAK
eukprot:506293-Prymnesium_polylepis.1